MSSCGWCGGEDAVELPYYSAAYRGWMEVCAATGQIAWARSAVKSQEVDDSTAATE